VLCLGQSWKGTKKNKEAGKERKIQQKIETLFENLFQVFFLFLCPKKFLKNLSREYTHLLVFVLRESGKEERF
jgi:hypothetical protein